jgi:Peptidase M15
MHALAAGVAIVAGLVALWPKRRNTLPPMPPMPLTFAPHFPALELDPLGRRNPRPPGYVAPDADELRNLARLSWALERIREIGGNTPIAVSSGYRPRTYDEARAARGAYQMPRTISQHWIGLAADLQPRNGTPAELHSLILAAITAGQIPNGGVGIYPTFVHYDLGPPARRWTG